MGALVIILSCCIYLLFLITVIHVENNLGYLSYKLLGWTGYKTERVEYVDHLSYDAFRACLQSTLLLLIFLTILSIGVDNVIVP